MDNQPFGNYICYDAEKLDYSITDAEIRNLKAAGQNQWKDFFLVSLPFGIPCIINAIHDTPEPFILTYALFLTLFQSYVIELDQE